MKFSWITRSLQAGAIASAVLLMLPAGAETKAPNKGKPRHSQRDSSGEPANASRLATSSQNYGAADYQRNASARCDIFKTPEDRSACAKRLQQAPQGSVQGGGVLREYSYEVPADGS